MAGYDDDHHDHDHRHYQHFDTQDTWWSQCSPTESGANYPWNVSDSLNQSLVILMMLVLILMIMLMLLLIASTNVS